MSKSIIKQLLARESSEELYDIIDNIPLQQIEDTITETDFELKNLLSQYSEVVHQSMQSHHNIGSVDSIRKQFVVIEGYLRRIVYKQLPIYERFFLSIVEFFVDNSQNEELENCIKKIQISQREILVYNTMLMLKSKDFLKYLSIYQNWVTALSKFVPNIIDKYGIEQVELSYALSKTIMRASEFLLTNRQLESTITLQMQNNQVVLTDMMHIVAVSKSLIQNTISAKQFFEQEYVGSIKIIKRYNNKR